MALLTESTSKEMVTYMWLAAGTIGAATVVYTAVRSFAKRKYKRKIHPPDTVILHQFGRSAHCPSLSPFCQKLETYLRLAKIPYVNEFSLEMSSKGKMPWIEYNGEEIADSQFCIEFLNNKFGVNLNKDLSDTDLGISRAFMKLTEESLLWYIPLDRFVYESNADWYLENRINTQSAQFLKKKMKQAAHYHGIGRHEQDQVYEITTKDLTSLSNFLGTKSFMFGEKPTEVDCTVFSMLSQIKYNMPGSHAANLINGSLSNLSTYCERMKAEVWPDWNSCCTMEALA